MMQEAVRAVAALSGKDVFVMAPSSSGVEILKHQGFATLVAHGSSGLSRATSQPVRCVLSGRSPQTIFSMRDIKVVGFTPKSSAAPEAKARESEMHRTYSVHDKG